MIRGLIGVVHLLPMPGDPAYRGDGGFLAAEKFALRDAQAWVDGGADALIIENFGSAPFPKGDAAHRLPPHQVAALAVMARRCAELGIPVGVNCLRNDVISALGIAAAVGLAFVRVNVHTGAYVTDQGVIEGEADVSLRYRATLHAHHVKIFADCLVKHAVPLAPVDPIVATRDTLLRGLADGVVVTGTATGAAIDAGLLQKIHHAAGNATVLLGSGVTPESADSLAPWADGAFIGTWAKEGGKIQNPVDAKRVAALAQALRPKFRAAR